MTGDFNGDCLANAALGALGGASIYFTERSGKLENFVRLNVRANAPSSIDWDGDDFDDAGLQTTLVFRRTTARRLAYIAPPSRSPKPTSCAVIVHGAKLGVSQLQHRRRFLQQLSCGSGHS